MENTPYFPPLYGAVECGKCKKWDCMNRGKYQRNCRDFSYTSGRCPRLPDRQGFMEKEETELYAAAFPVVYAERGGDSGLLFLSLAIKIPGEKRGRKVYYTKTCGGHWYFRTKTEYGYPGKRAISISEFSTTQEIIEHMRRANTEKCVFRCTIEDYWI